VSKHCCYTTFPDTYAEPTKQPRDAARLGHAMRANVYSCPSAMKRVEGTHQPLTISLSQTMLQ
jgi:hypothetical protein